ADSLVDLLKQLLQLTAAEGVAVKVDDRVRALTRCGCGRCWCCRRCKSSAPATTTNATSAAAASDLRGLHQARGGDDAELDGHEGFHPRRIGSAAERPKLRVAARDGRLCVHYHLSSGEPLIDRE